jgi:DNA-binding MarR family transcriptional regulator
MRDVSNASQTTAYRRVVALRDKGIVELRVDSKDRRIRFVEPTANALDYAVRLETALAETPSLVGSRT